MEPAIIVVIKRNNLPIFEIEKESLVLESIEAGQIGADLSEYSGLADFIDKTLTKSNKKILNAISGKPEGQDGKRSLSISFNDLVEEFQKCKNLNTVFQKLNKALSIKINKDCQSITDSLFEMNESLGKNPFITLKVLG